jgi:hexokinase
MDEITGFAGSMADVPKDLLDQINRLEEQFTVPTDKLKAITEHFISELAKGLTVEGGSIVSLLLHLLSERKPDCASP